MKTVGLIGGMSWESTLDYYRILNETVKEKRGGLSSCKMVLVSVDFSEIERLQRLGDWNALARMMTDAALRAERGGADFLMIGANTMHKVAEAVQAGIGIPLLHIADAAAEKIKARGIRKVALLGTRFTMEEDFYINRLTSRHNLDVLIPEHEDRDLVHRVIYDELCKGEINPESREEYRRIINSLVTRGAEGIILGCTEIAMLIDQTDAPVPVFDTTRIHAVSAVELALQA